MPNYEGVRNNKKQTLVILVDSKSTHNFIDHTIAKRLKCKIQGVNVVRVIVANGDTLKAQEVCKMVSWES